MQGFNLVEFPGTIILYQIPQHSFLKESLLDSIEKTEFNSFKDDNQSISKTDFFNNSNENLNYKQILAPIFSNYVENLKVFLENDDLKLGNIWFQQYERDDFHTWHSHRHAYFSNVYYLEMSDKAPKTSFRHFGKVFEVPVKEGMIITFPSYLMHCSKPNQSSRKTVITFNVH